MSSVSKQFSNVVNYIKFEMMQVAQKQATELQMNSNAHLIAEVGLDDPSLEGELSFDSIEKQFKETIERYQLMNITPNPNEVIDYSCIEYQVMVSLVTYF